MPALAKAVLQTARPAVAVETAIPEQPEMTLPPSLKVIVPPSGVGPTVAVSVSGDPAKAGLREEVRLVVVAVAPGIWAIVNAVTWSPLAVKSFPPPALGVAKWLTSAPVSGTEK
jgi:hypothetical protein